MSQNTPLDAGRDERPDNATAPDGTTFTRRTFLQGVGLAAGVVAAGVVPAVLTAGTAAAQDTTATPLAPTVPGAGEDPLASIIAQDQPANYPGHPVYYADPAGPEKWAMVIDVKACVGCRRCVYACVEENNIGRNSGFTFIQVLEMEAGKIDLESAVLDYGEAGRPDKWYLPVQCMHCAKPPCVYGCPVIATWKEPDGTVLIDYNKCIGCRNCIITCPYGARHFNWVHPEVPAAEVNPKVPLAEKAWTAEKCTFCVQRTRHGQTTACVEACPVGARKFGDLNDPNSDVAILLRTRRVWRLKEEESTEPMIWYVG